jgi:tRNA (guanine-N7-)-methyltransferase
LTDLQDRPIRSYGRRNARKLSARQQALIDKRLPELSVPVAPPGSLLPLSLFDGHGTQAWLEIGFGGGEHLIAQAMANPQAGLIGCEPFIDGMAKALGQIESKALENIRLHMGDARELMTWLREASLARVFILFPDPWPKARHFKRRLIQPDFLDELFRVTRPGGEIRFATDVRSYADWAIARFLAHGGFNWLAARADDWRCPPRDHVTTRYEAKRLGDIAPVWLRFERRMSLR